MTVSPETITDFCDRHQACPEGRRWALANCKTMQEAWDTAKPEWVVWIATRPGVLDETTRRRFALFAAGRVRRLMRNPRSTHLLDVAERHLRGEVTDKELAAARAAARAAGAAARAARAAAVADARAAAWDAAWAAEDASGDGAWAAAWAAERAAQAAWLRANAKPNWEGDAMTVSPETIARFVIPSTTTKPRVRRRLTEDGESEVLEMRARGFTYAEIASRVGVAWGTVKKCIQRNSRPGHSRWDLRRAEVDRMKAMRKEGMTYDEISSATGRSRGAVYRWVTGKEYQ